LNGGKQKQETVWLHLNMYGLLQTPLRKMDGPKAPTAIHGPSGRKYYLREKANTTADCLVINFTPHDLCDENNER
jgi:hypothetical protein